MKGSAINMRKKGVNEMVDLTPVAPYREVEFRGKIYKRPGISPARAAMAEKKILLAPGALGTDENPIMKDGYPYVYSSTGKLVRRLDFDPETMEIYVLKKGAVLTEEQKAMLQKAASMPITYDEECPKSSPERMERFKRFGIERNKRLREARLAQ